MNDFLTDTFCTIPKHRHQNIFLFFRFNIWSAPNEQLPLKAKKNTYTKRKAVEKRLKWTKIYKTNEKKTHLIFKIDETFTRKQQMSGLTHTNTFSIQWKEDFIWKQFIYWIVCLLFIAFFLCLFQTFLNFQVSIIRQKWRNYMHPNQNNNFFLYPSFLFCSFLLFQRSFRIFLFAFWQYFYLYSVPLRYILYRCILCPSNC